MNIFFGNFDDTPTTTVPLYRAPAMHAPVPVNNLPRGDMYLNGRCPRLPDRHQGYRLAPEAFLAKCPLFKGGRGHLFCDSFIPFLVCSSCLWTWVWECLLVRRCLHVHLFTLSCMFAPFMTVVYMCIRGGAHASNLRVITTDLLRDDTRLVCSVWFVNFW